MKGIALLSGPALHAGAEPLDDHITRLGPLPPPAAALVPEIERADLRGRGGAGYPVAAKWRAVASHADGRGVVLVNGAEGEPLSQKDRLLMSSRPHLVLDGAVLAARAVGANRIVLYVGAAHHLARAALMEALRMRGGSDRIDFEMVTAPTRYVAGEESAAVHCVNDGIALPSAVPQRPSERGVAGRPTLVQNVESLAHAAVIARFGGQWFADLGHNGSTGTMLLTLSGDVRTPVIVEVAGGTSLSTVLAACTTVPSSGSAVLLGGYFGGWIHGDAASDLVIDPVRLRAAGHSLGCGVVHVRGGSECGVVHTAHILNYLADQTARQCGPCVFGLRAIAGALGRVAARQGSVEDLLRVRTWSGELSGRGACRHPDGAANLVRSALHVFADEFVLHAQSARCTAAGRVERAA
jgi:NADH:ubiquinone oxidoreductase subunit F (NADH-binding)